jgi:hypothetical protein
VRGAAAVSSSPDGGGAGELTASVLDPLCLISARRVQRIPAGSLHHPRLLLLLLLSLSISVSACIQRYGKIK